ncbi:MAG TPA: hypothetical protein VFQ45_15195 [Longimicrobium sp.]|nr:hypothetical protein [Longimicrobium sp.]
MQGPLLVSLVLHGLGLVFVLGVEGHEVPKPKVKVYRVDIVSPPPTQLGEPMAEPPANQEPGPAQPETPAAPEPAPPEPEPEPAKALPAERTPPKEPAKAPETRRPPETARERPAATTPATRPATPATRPGTGGDTDRSRGEGTRTGPTTGRNPDPNSEGGEGIEVHTEGEPCPVAGYCERVQLQVERFFRPPLGTARASGEVCFRIMRDGIVRNIEVRNVRGGGAGFRLALMEAAEAAGQRRAFGALPSAFDPARWRWCVEMSGK